MEQHRLIRARHSREATAPQTRAPGHSGPAQRGARKWSRDVRALAVLLVTAAVLLGAAPASASTQVAAGNLPDAVTDREGMTHLVWSERVEPPAWVESLSPRHVVYLALMSSEQSKRARGPTRQALSMRVGHLAGKSA